MAISLTDKPKGDPAAIKRKFRGAGAKQIAQVDALVDTFYAIGPQANLNPDAAVAQFSEETGKGTSDAWATRFNPAGYGITGPLGGGGKDYGYSFPDGKTAALWQLVHLSAYAFGVCPDVLKDSQSLDKRWQNVIDAGWGGSCKTVDDLSNKWASDPDYGDKIAVHYDWLIGDAPAAGAQAMYTTEIPGMPGGPFVTDYPIKIKLIPASNTYQRPGIKAQTPRRSVQHGTGNPNSMAAGEIAYLVDQRSGGAQVSFHACADDREVWIAVPADEVTWQAADGAGPGNMCGFSCEQIENAALWADPDRSKRCIAITADFMGKAAARLDIAIPEQHYTFNYNDPNRHDCPDKLRHTIGAWGAYTAAWSAAKAAELARMGGTPAPAPEPVKWVKPAPIKGLPEYADYQNDTVKALITNEGMDFVFVGDVVEATETFPRRQWASYAKNAEINQPIEKGERFIVAWLFKSKAEGDYWYVTPEWTRVPQKPTTRVADAPLV